jgi:hypothetical protein
MKSKNKLPPWLKPKTPAATTLVSVGWYTEDQWAKVKASAVDAKRFEATYVEWVEMAKQALVELRASGITAEESYITASELLAWCLAHDKPNDAASRAEFVSEQGRKANESGV